MLGENHSVHHEFPEKKELIDALIKNNQHFKKIAKEYDELDKKIRVIELKNSPIDHQSFHEMKKKTEPFKRRNLSDATKSYKITIL